MRGVQFVTDTEGNRVAVMLDLKEWGELWEDFYDNMLADQRAGEELVSIDDVERDLRSE